MRNIKLILEELQRVLESDSPKDEDVISIYDVADVVRSKYIDYKDTIEEYNINIELDAQELYDDNTTYIHGFDYDTNKLTIGFKYGICDRDKIVFLKDDERGLYIESSKGKHAKDFFAVAYKDINDLYDEFLKFKDLKTQSVEGRKSINSKFVYDINTVTTTLNYTVGNNVKCNLFELEYNHYDDEYRYDCNSSLILDILKDNEDLLFKKIFVRIEDCPEWTREALYNKRKHQLEEEKKKQKKLELKRKFFPWIK